MEEIIVFENGKIITLDENDSICNSLVIHREKIIDIGEKIRILETIENLKVKLKQEQGKEISIKTIDLKGNIIVPGFIDAHLHPILAIYYKTQIKLSHVKSIAELKKIIQKENEIREKEDWIVCFDLMENRFTDKNEQVFPDRKTIDNICSERPVVIFRFDGHICVANSNALKSLNINSDTLDSLTFELGEIQLDDQGEPNGIFTEGATNFVLEKIPMPSNKVIKKTSKEFSNELNLNGITSCGVVIQEGDIGIAGKAGSLELPLLKYLLKEGVIEQDLAIYIVTDKPKKLDRIKKQLKKIVGPSDQFQVQGVKLWADGSFGALTAYVYEPFSDSPEKKVGFMVVPEETLINIFGEAYDRGYDISCHAIGDRANDIVLEIYSKFLNKKNCLKYRQKNVHKPVLRIEHASLLNEEIIKKAAEMGVIIASQPLFIDSEHSWLEKRLGSDRIKHVYPFRSIIEAGIILAGASDAPIEPPNVLRAIQTSILRNGFETQEAINAKEALKMFTINAALAIGQEIIKGSIEKDKYADFVILNEDITSIKPEEIHKVQILSTYHRGKEIYSRGN